MSKGTKNDQGKPRLSLNPKEAVWGMANAFTHGANKYGDHNFKEGIEYTRLADACMRHLTAFIDGEDLDNESGNCHIDHALASLGMLKYMMENKPEMDDRYKPTSTEVKIGDGQDYAEMAEKVYLANMSGYKINMGDK